MTVSARPAQYSVRQNVTRVNLVLQSVTRVLPDAILAYHQGMNQVAANQLAVHLAHRLVNQNRIHIFLAIPAIIHVEAGIASSLFQKNAAIQICVSTRPAMIVS